MYITGHGEQVAAIVPAAVAAELERLSPGELAGLLEDFADAAVAREARGRVSGRLAENPGQGQATQLVRDPRTWRVRAGDQRVLYEIHDDEIVGLIHDVEHRSKGYGGR